jgi:HSP20 family protein
MANIRVLNPWSMLPSVWEDANELMERSFGGVPKVNMFEKDEMVHVEVEVPGYTAEDLDISITGDLLKITGKSKDQTEERKDRRYYMTEISERSFTRTITLPYEVVSDKASATFANGMLKLTMPKSEKALPRTIKIETTGQSA